MSNEKFESISTGMQPETEAAVYEAERISKHADRAYDLPAQFPDYQIDAVRRSAEFSRDFDWIAQDYGFGEIYLACLAADNGIKLYRKRVPRQELPDKIRGYASKGLHTSAIAILVGYSNSYVCQAAHDSCIRVERKRYAKKKRPHENSVPPRSFHQEIADYWTGSDAALNSRYVVPEQEDSIE